jgi:hypothetical protein
LATCRSFHEGAEDGLSDGKLLVTPPEASNLLAIGVDGWLVATVDVVAAEGVAAWAIPFESGVVVDAGAAVVVAGATPGVAVVAAGVAVVAVAAVGVVVAVVAVGVVVVDEEAGAATPPLP